MMDKVEKLKTIKSRYLLVPMSQKRDVKIIVNCPLCGRPGKLVVGAATSFGKRRYKVVHSRRDKCSIGICHKKWDTIDKIYEEVRVKYKNAIREYLKDSKNLQPIDSNNLPLILSRYISPSPSKDDGNET